MFSYSSYNIIAKLGITSWGMSMHSMTLYNQCFQTQCVGTHPFDNREW